MIDGMPAVDVQIQQGLTGYYFRKLSRYLQPEEFRKVRALRDRTSTPQITVPELMFLRWLIRRFKPDTESPCFDASSLKLR